MVETAGSAEWLTLEMRLLAFLFLLMPATISHAYSQTVADGTATSVVRPSDWNSNHLFTMNAAGSEISGAFSNANGLSFGLSGTAVTGSYTVPSTTGFAGTGFTSTTTAGTAIVGTHNTGGLSLGVPAYLTTAMQSNALTISNINVSAGASSNNVSAVTFSNLNGVTFGYDKTNITASINSTSGAGTGFTTTTVAGAVIAGTNNSAGLNLAVPAYLTTADLSQNSSNYISAWSLAGAHTAGTTTSAAGTEIFFSGGNNITLSGNSNTIVISAGAGNSSVNFSAGANSANLGTVVFSNSNNVSFGLNGSTITASAGGGAQVTLSKFVPFPLIGGTAAGSTNPASAVFAVFTAPNPFAVQNVQMPKSFNIGVPAATSQNSSGTLAYSFSQGLSLFSRVDFGANSSVISYVTSGSGGLTAGMTYSSSSQTWKVNWVTDTTGGTTSFSTTSSSNGWSNFQTGMKLFQVPLVATVTAGEYFMGMWRSSTSGTTGSNVTLLSVSDYVLNNTTLSYGSYSASSPIDQAEAFMGHIGAGWGRASSVTTNNTMALSAISTVGGPTAPFAQFIAISGDLV